MRTLGSHAGFLEIDHTHSPGLSPADVAHVPSTIAVGAGQRLERDVKQCSHCQRAVVLNPGRVRDRAVCPKCYHYICDSCDTLRVATGECVPFMAVMERAETFLAHHGIAQPSSADFAPFAPKVSVSKRQVMQGLLVPMLEQARRFYDAGDYDSAEPYLHSLIDAGIRNALLTDALGTVYQFQGRLSTALSYCRQALVIDPAYQDAYDRIVMLTDALPSTTPAEAQAVRSWWWEQCGAEAYATRQPHTNTTDRERSLRVGYVSGDFWHHSACAVFSQVVLKHTEAVEPFFYSSTPAAKYDAVTAVYQALPGWREVEALTDAQVVDAIRADAIDILIDLSGHTLFNRLRAFAAQPAPIQMQGWGYANGTGWPDAMQYVLADDVVLQEGDCTEQIVNLPCVLPFAPPEDLPLPSPLPCLTQAPTFGVFQRPLKINAEGLAIWTQILERVPNARLILKGQYGETLVRWIREQMKSVSDRVEIRTELTPHVDHLQAYDAIDLALDPWPQCGGVSSCEALWMGVPMVTLWGDRSIQRTSASLLTNLGLPEFIAQTSEQYVDRAVAFVTTQKQELAEIRQGLRAQYADWNRHARYLEAVEASYRSAWHTWCDRDADT